MAALEEGEPGSHQWPLPGPGLAPPATGPLEALELLAAAAGRPDIHQHWLCEGFNYLPVAMGDNEF